MGYAVEKTSDADWDAIRKDRWLMDNVWPSLPLRGQKWKLYSVGDAIKHRLDPVGVLDTSDTRVRPGWVIANEVRDFILAVDAPELWAWYAAYDHVALCQLWGRMIGLPSGVPMWTNDLKQEAHRLGNPVLPDQAEGEHNALEDPRHNLVRARLLDDIAKEG